MRSSTFTLLACISMFAVVIAFIGLRSNQPPEDTAPVAEAAPVSSAGRDDPSPAAHSVTQDISVTPEDSVASQDNLTAAATSPPKAAASSSSPKEDHAAAPVVPLKFPQWPAPPLALVATGEQLGYFEPCGCTANQLGGMSRRASLFEQIRSLGWEVRGVDVGSVSRRTGTQAKLKFETSLAAFRELNYVALALAPEELRLEPGYLLSQHLTDGDNPLRFLGANLMFFGSKDLGTPVASTIFEVNGVKVGVTSVMSDTIRKSIVPDMTPDEAANAEIQWTDPAEAMTAVMKEFDDAGVAVRVLLAQTTLEESKKLAEDFPKLTLVVRANGFGEGIDNPEIVGQVRLVQVGKKGKAAGVIGLYPNDPENPVRFELVTLSGEQFPASERMTQLMQGYQDRLKSGAVAKNDGTVAHPSGASFVGASKCGECHTKAFDIWKNTPHAHAFERLNPALERKGFERLRGVNKSFDPECIACHVTGWNPEEYLRYETGFINEEFAADDAEKQLQGLLAGNQCENCHGPGSRHVELIEADQKSDAIKEVKVTLQQSEQTCIRCHDGDNSPSFSFEEYWKDVKHDGKD